MLKTLTFVKKLPHLDHAAFFERWCQHTREWDLRDHPEITLNRLMLVDGHDGYSGVAENHWPDRAALDAVAAWYATPAGQPHWQDLCSFMDMAASVTVIVSNEASIVSID
jgi:hypothetical protein